MAAPPQRLVVVSNRLPYVLDKQAGGGWALKPGSGGLVTALLPVLRDRGGTWIGWPGRHRRGAGHRRACFGRRLEGPGIRSNLCC